MSKPLAKVILSAWAGSLWTICGLVVPGLFWLMPDNKHQAGQVAAQFFNIESVLATVFALMYWALQRRQLDQLASRCWWAALLMPLLFLLILRPVMSATLAAGNLARFGQLHGVAATLFLIACVAVGMLVWRPLLIGLKHPAE